MIETTRPELVAYQEERLAKFVTENQKLDKGQIVFAGDSVSYTHLTLPTTSSV